MKNLARLILALFATQLLVTGFARAAIASSTVEQKSAVCAMPGDENDGNSEGF